MSVENFFDKKFVSDRFCSTCLAQEHTKVSDEKKERNDKWDKHTNRRPGSDEKKKDPKKGWIIRKTPTKEKLKRKNSG